MLSDSLETGLEAIRGYGDQWWIVVSKRLSNTYYSIRLSSDGVDSVSSFSVGQSPISQNAQSCFSPDGTKYARYSPPYSGVSLFSFNRMTGLLGDYKRIDTDTIGLFGGLAFSPNSRYVYVSNILKLYQIDTEFADSDSNIVLIDSFDGYSDPFPATFYLMQLGPDCKIYMIPNNGIRVMHVISHPDLQGKECDFIQHGIHLPVPNSISIPNFPLVRFDPDNVCDTNIVVNTKFNEIGDGQIVRPIIFPNPSSGDLNIQNESDKTMRIVIYDPLGHTVVPGLIVRPGYSEAIKLPSGMYFYVVESAGDTTSSGRISVID